MYGIAAFIRGLIRRPPQGAEWGTVVAGMLVMAALVAAVVMLRLAR